MPVQTGQFTAFLGVQEVNPERVHLAYLDGEKAEFLDPLDVNLTPTVDLADEQQELQPVQGRLFPLFRSSGSWI